ncbi:unnamed protein product [Anisakis simplex]|uniref:Secreted protein n=1 Tax=Anisakis simplex TaxID=6269 RepID=A0A0M3JFE3_ANISI|nr:unnamed protein product [Anisakis simplex]
MFARFLLTISFENGYCIVLHLRNRQLGDNLRLGARLDQNGCRSDLKRRMLDGRCTHLTPDEYTMILVGE